MKLSFKPGTYQTGSFAELTPPILKPILFFHGDTADLIVQDDDPV
jgi:hypothetical protein